MSLEGALDRPSMVWEEGNRATHRQCQCYREDLKSSQSLEMRLPIGHGQPKRRNLELSSTTDTVLLSFARFSTSRRAASRNEIHDYGLTEHCLFSRPSQLTEEIPSDAVRNLIQEQAALPSATSRLRLPRPRYASTRFNALR